MAESTGASRTPQEVIAAALLATKDDGPMMYVETHGDDDQWAAHTADLLVRSLRQAGVDARRAALRVPPLRPGAPANLRLLDVA